MLQIFSGSAEKFFEKPEGKLLMKVLMITFVIGLIAHAYAYFGPIFSHDSLLGIYVSESEDVHKIGLGRVLSPVYRILAHGRFTMPWLTGVTALAWIALSVYMSVRMFNLSSTPMIVLVAGMFATNVTVSAITATYIHELDTYMFGLFMATAGAWVWHKSDGEFGYAMLGAVCVAMALGIYQSYISVTIALIMIVCILWLLEGRGAKYTLVRGLQAIAMLAAGAVLYLAMVKITTLCTGVSLISGEYNSLTNAAAVFDEGILKRILFVYYNFARCFFKYVKDYTGYPGYWMVCVNAVLFLCAGVAVVRVLCMKVHKIVEKLMLLALGALLPFAMNCSSLFNGGTHSLMHYAYAFLYLAVILVIRWAVRSETNIFPKTLRSGTRWIAGILMMMILTGNVQASNAMYLKKDLERQTTLSALTRIADEMSECDEYVPGVTPVVFCHLNGAKDSVEPFRRYKYITGMGRSQSVSYPITYAFYFTQILNEPLKVMGNDVIDAFSKMDAVQQMPAYPKNGYVQMVDGHLIVRMS